MLSQCLTKISARKRKARVTVNEKNIAEQGSNKQNIYKW